MAKRGNHQGFVRARVNAHVENRDIIADDLFAALERGTETSVLDDEEDEPPFPTLGKTLREILNR